MHFLEKIFKVHITRRVAEYKTNEHRNDKLGFSAHYVRTNQTIKKVFWLLFPFRFCVSKWLP